MCIDMKFASSIAEAQRGLPRLVKDAARDGAVAIAKRGETVAYLVSRKRMAAITETLDILGNPDAMRAVRKYRQGKMMFQPL